MPGLQTKSALYLALVALGIYAQVAQALLIRENLVVFYGNEVSLGAFFGSWLFWVAAGSVSVLLWRRRAWIEQPLPLLRSLLLALPFLLAVQITATRLVRHLLEVSAAEFVPLGELFAAILIITLPTSFAVGLAFPLACKALGKTTPTVVKTGSGETQATVRAVSGLYIFDAIGAMAGGVLFTFVMIEWLGVWRSLGAVTLLLGLTAFLLADGFRRPASLLGLVTGIIGLGLLATPLGHGVQERMEAARFSSLQPGLELLDSVETRYGHVAVARLGEQISVINDGRITASFPNPEQAQAEAAYFYTQASGARRVLLFGGLATGLAEELLRYPVEQVDVVEEDRLAFERLRPWLTPATQAALADPRLVMHFMDGRRFANTLPDNAAYDLVLVLAADPASAHSNRYFTVEFYREMRRAMSPDGVLCTSVSSASNYLGREVRSYSGSVFRTLSKVFPELAIMPGDEHVYCAATRAGRVSEDPHVLEQRYLDTPLQEYRFPSMGFLSLLLPDQIRFVRRQLEEEQGEVNTDARPVTYYLNMMLWGKFSGSAFVEWLETMRGMGVWPYLIPPAVFICLMLLHAGVQAVPRPRLRRDTATLALVMLGVIAMAVQLALLFSYQAHVGFMFGRIALLNGVFMTGLALGAGALGQRLARLPRAGLPLAGLLALTACLLALLPMLLDWLGGLDTGRQEAAYLSLCLAAGLLTGTGFPLGVLLAHQDTREILTTSGLIGAADDLGGAVGGLLTGALLVPILGVAGTCYLLAAFAVLALLPLLFAEVAWQPQPWLQARGYRAFPFAGFSRLVLFVTVTLYLLTLVARGSGPAPLVHFDEGVLAEVSGSADFQLREKPVPHYLGKDAGSESGGEFASAAADTVSLATQPVAADIHGYAGPLNLLVSVDRDAVLRGVRLIASAESPSYTAGLGDWLAGLAGTDVADAPLDLARIDALSGATVSSSAALASLNRAVQAGSEAAFGQRFAPATETGVSHSWLTPGFLLTLLLVLAFFPVYLSGRENVRLLYQAAVLGILGFSLNNLITEVDLVNLSQGQFPSFETAPQHWLLLVFVLVTLLLFGQAYCGYVCPFGALQEFISRLGRRLYLRRYPVHGIELRARYLKFILLGLMLCSVWLSDDVTWSTFNPMQHVFGGHFPPWMLLITGLGLIGALFYYRFWCRYFCPFGAFLALGNKLALLKRFTPRRRFEHCDLGVRDEYDIDCLHCHRCLSGRDFGVRAPAVSRRKRTELNL
jgi:predicted membrane-bound spermidine synthase/Na+-translocating ferredoxin:NAD+ oxidoreductase RnfG subunit